MRLFWVRRRRSSIYSTVQESVWDRTSRIIWAPCWASSSTKAAPIPDVPPYSSALESWAYGDDYDAGRHMSKILIDSSCAPFSQSVEETNSYSILCKWSLQYLPVVDLVGGQDMSKEGERHNVETKYYTRYRGVAGST